MPKKSIINPDSEKYYIEEHMENELATPEEIQPIEEPKQYKRNFTDEGREKQKIHLENIRKKAIEKKRELKEITLKSKLMKLEPKKELAKQYDEYINQKIQQPQPQPQQQQQPEQQIVYIQKPVKEKKKKIIYKEVEEEEEEEEEEEIVYVKKPKPKVAAAGGNPPRPPKGPSNKKDPAKDPKKKPPEGGLGYLVKGNK
jgi:hypothetical protein